MIIVSYHISYVFNTGWIFVEFFFMLSGYFAFRHYMSGKEVSEPENFPVIYAVKKLLRILPYSAIALITLYIRQVIVNSLSLKDSVRYGLYVLQNLFLMNGTGMVPKYFKVRDDMVVKYMPLPELWYLTVLIVAIPLMLYLVRCAYKKLGLGLVAVLPFMIYGYMIMKDGSINGWHEGMGFYLTLCMRGLAGLLLGGLIYYISEKIKGRRQETSALSGTILLLAEIGAFAGVAMIATLRESSFEMLSVILFIVSLSITFSGVTVTSKIHGGFFTVLGKLSLPIYCIHPVVRYYFGADDKVKYYLITIAAAVVMAAVVEGIGCLAKKRTA